VADTADMPAAGNAESPISVVTWPSGKPSPSATTWLITVYVPVPMSCVAIRSVARPSAPTVTLAVAGKAAKPCVSVAMPQPTYSSPSRIDPGLGSRFAQPNASAAIR
jgi:hypothetical protein